MTYVILISSGEILTAIGNRSIRYKSSNAVPTMRKNAPTQGQPGHDSPKMARNLVCRREERLESSIKRTNDAMIRLQVTFVLLCHILCCSCQVGRAFSPQPRPLNAPRTKLPSLPSVYRSIRLPSRLYYLVNPDVSDALDTLNLSPTPGQIDKKAIKSAYKKMAMKFHPDVVLDNHSSEEEKRLANDRFARINWAYETLTTDPSEEETSEGWWSTGGANEPSSSWPYCRPTSQWPRARKNTGPSVRCPQDIGFGHSASAHWSARKGGATRESSSRTVNNGPSTSWSHTSDSGRAASTFSRHKVSSTQWPSSKGTANNTATRGAVKNGPGKVWSHASERRRSAPARSERQSSSQWPPRTQSSEQTPTKHVSRSGFSTGRAPKPSPPRSQNAAHHTKKTASSRRPAQPSQKSAPSSGPSSSAKSRKNGVPRSSARSSGTVSSTHSSHNTSKQRSTRRSRPKRPVLSRTTYKTEPESVWSYYTSESNRVPSSCDSSVSQSCKRSSTTSESAGGASPTTMWSFFNGSSKSNLSSGKSATPRRPPEQVFQPPTSNGNNSRKMSESSTVPVERKSGSGSAPRHEESRSVYSVGATSRQWSARSTNLTGTSFSRRSYSMPSMSRSFMPTPNFGSPTRPVATQGTATIGGRPTTATVPRAFTGPPSNQPQKAARWKFWKLQRFTTDFSSPQTITGTSSARAFTGPPTSRSRRSAWWKFWKK